MADGLVGSQKVLSEKSKVKVDLSGLLRFAAGERVPMVLRVLAGIPVTVPSFYSEYRQKVLDSVKAALCGSFVEFEICVSPKTRKQGGEGIVEASNYLAEKCVSEGYMISCGL